MWPSELSGTYLHTGEEDAKVGLEVAFNLLHAPLLPKSKVLKGVKIPDKNSCSTFKLTGAKVFEGTLHHTRPFSRSQVMIEVLKASFLMPSKQPKNVCL